VGFACRSAFGDGFGGRIDEPAAVVRIPIIRAMNHGRIHPIWSDRDAILLHSSTVRRGALRSASSEVEVATDPVEMAAPADVTGPT
jgi:hypothetical protein